MESLREGGGPTDGHLSFRPHRSAGLPRKSRAPLPRPPPEDEQVKALVELFEQERAAYAAKEDDAMKLATDLLGPLPKG